MTQTTRLWFLLASLTLAIGALYASSPAASKEAKPADTPEALAARAASIMKAKCLACHGDDPKMMKGGLDLRTREKVLEGGDRGEPAIVPGEPDKSPLIRSVERTDPDFL